MLELNKDAMLNVNGGNTIDVALISSLINSASTFYDMGRSVGSSVRKLIYGILY